MWHARYCQTGDSRAESSCQLCWWSDRGHPALSVSCPAFDGDDDALCAVSPAPHHLHAVIIHPAVTDSHLCFQLSHAEWMKFISSTLTVLNAKERGSSRLEACVCGQLELVWCWNCACKVGCLNISSDRSPVSCNLTLGDILQPNERQERGSRRPRMSALLASAARFYASTVDRRRLQVMARRGVTTLVEVVSCVLSSCNCFFCFLFCFILFCFCRKHENTAFWALPSAIIHFENHIKCQLSCDVSPCLRELYYSRETQSSQEETERSPDGGQRWGFTFTQSMTSCSTVIPHRLYSYCHHVFIFIC